MNNNAAGAIIDNDGDNLIMNSAISVRLPRLDVRHFDAQGRVPVYSNGVLKGYIRLEN